MVGVANPYPGAHFASGFTGDKNWTTPMLSVNTGRIPAPPSQRPVHALSPFITNWKQDLAIEPLVGDNMDVFPAFMAALASHASTGLSGTYGLAGPDGAVARCGVATYTTSHPPTHSKGNNILFPDARILSPYAQFQLYQVPMNLVMCAIQGNLHLRIIRACDGRICADVALHAPTGLTDFGSWVSTIGGLSVTPLPQPTGSRAPGPAYWGNRPLLEPAYEARRNTTSTKRVNSDPYGITGAACDLGEAVASSGLWNGPAPRGQATDVEMARANDGPWNLWRVIWTAPNGMTGGVDSPHGVVYTGVLASSRTCSALPQSAVLEESGGGGFTGAGARWWAL